MSAQYAASIALHDKAIAESGLEIWLGSEPTFTLRTSEEPQWLSQALGGDKEALALRMTAALAWRHPGSVILRTVGRQYGGESVPRWSFGVYERRDHQPVWHGPGDPALSATDTLPLQAGDGFGDGILQVFNQHGWPCRRLPDSKKRTEIRLLARLDDADPGAIDDADPRLARASVHTEKSPPSGLKDELANEGFYLFVIRQTAAGKQGSVISLELPAFERVTDFLECLNLLGQAAAHTNLPHLLLQGFQPPIDQSVAWTTITPDPAVIEINQAPQPDISGFHAANREVFEIADELGLSPYRMQYNGTVSDSGGGGQFTLGGRTAATSPFFTAPGLLPRLVRYVNLHPSLSYWFATNYIGGASQSPRADEGTLDSFYELGLALEQLERQRDITPEFLYNSLAPFLADASGNSHRSELNIEKLWNTGLPHRGCLGLLEFRAFRMPLTPARSVAIAVLLRALAGMLASHDLAPDLKAWKEALHDRFALPFFLHRDLEAVLADLERTGFGLGPELKAELLATPERARWETSLDGCRLEIEQAMEFWPLVGDVASQERGGSRLVDSSTLRLQLSLSRESQDCGPLNEWQLSADGYQIPLRVENKGGDEIRLTGLRFRDFVPWRGLHPSIAPTNPVVLHLCHPDRAQALEVRLHNWRADGIPYDGLPDDLEDAAQRRAQRLLVKPVARADLPPGKPAPDQALTDYSFDLRCL